MKHILIITLALTTSSAFCMESAAPTNAEVATPALTVSLSALPQYTNRQELQESLLPLQIYCSGKAFAGKNGLIQPLAVMVDLCMAGNQSAYSRLQNSIQSKYDIDLANVGKSPRNHGSIASVNEQYHPVLAALEALKLHADQKNSQSPRSDDENRTPDPNARKAKSILEELPGSPRKKQTTMNLE